MNKTYLIALGICLIIGGFIGWNLKSNKCPEPVKPNTIIEYRDTSYTVPNAKPKFITKIIKDTIVYHDTIFIHNDIQYIAAIDSTFEDSSLTASIAFVSDIPLSDNSFFDMRFKVREKIITNTIIQTEDVGFWYKRFIVYAGLGLIYDLDDKLIHVGPNIGFGIRLN